MSRYIFLSHLYVLFHNVFLVLSKYGMGFISFYSKTNRAVRAYVIYNNVYLGRIA